MMVLSAEHYRSNILRNWVKSVLRNQLMPLHTWLRAEKRIVNRLLRSAP